MAIAYPKKALLPIILSNSNSISVIVALNEEPNEYEKNIKNLLEDFSFSNSENNSNYLEKTKRTNKIMIIIKLGRRRSKRLILFLSELNTHSKII